MISAWTLYWILKLDSFCELFGVITFFSGVVGILLVGLWIAVVGEDEKSLSDEELIKASSTVFIFLILPIFLISGFFWMFLPTTKEMSMIYVVPKVANSNFMQTVPAKLEKLANKELDSLLTTTNKDDNKRN